MAQMTFDFRSHALCPCSAPAPAMAFACASHSRAWGGGGGGAVQRGAPAGPAAPLRPRWCPRCPGDVAPQVLPRLQGMPWSPQGVAGTPQGVAGTPRGVAGTPQGVPGTEHQRVLHALCAHLTSVQRFYIHEVSSKGLWRPSTSIWEHPPKWFAVGLFTGYNLQKHQKGTYCAVRQHPPQWPPMLPYTPLGIPHPFAIPGGGGVIRVIQSFAWFSLFPELISYTGGAHVLYQSRMPRGFRASG